MSRPKGHRVTVKKRKGPYAPPTWLVVCTCSPFPVYSSTDKAKAQEHARKHEKKSKGDA